MNQHKNNDALGIKIRYNNFTIDGEYEVNEVSIEKKLLINGLNYEDIYFMYYSWPGIEDITYNCSILGLLSGISNTLCQEKFGSYLLLNCNEDNKNRYSEYIVDMWNNESYKRVDLNGFKDSILDSCNFSLLKNLTTLLANAFSSSKGVSIPALLSFANSPFPPAGVLIKGNPLAIDSSKTVLNPSAKEVCNNKSDVSI